MRNLLHRIRENDFLNVCSDDKLNRVAKLSITLRSLREQSIRQEKVNVHFEFWSTENLKMIGVSRTVTRACPPLHQPP